MESDLIELAYSGLEVRQHDNDEPSCIDVQDR